MKEMEWWAFCKHGQKRMDYFSNARKSCNLGDNSIQNWRLDIRRKFSFTVTCERSRKT